MILCNPDRYYHRSTNSIVFINKQKKECKIIDITATGDQNIIFKELEKIIK